ncbi:transporter substrate-binding domain-containing diguanylate cyclase [Sulfurospirillum arcachonense]|uniref:transporter substrate-binding domain-containing diguanylate cyclase n=1 Tax=Sulfurospirillum arcachonense TaxID=57666 RepID=UPI0004698AE6|nr:transporter substrate-binding domain-containing protein [Sulfurospirillum arcachonense]
MRIFLFLLLLLSISLNATILNLTDEEKNYIGQKHILKVSNELDWYPYDFNQQEKAKGYAVDYFKLLATKIGLDVVFVTDNWKSLNKKFITGTLDVLYPARKTQEREKIALFSDEFLKMRLSLITQSKEKKIKSLNDMDGKILAVIKGWSSAELIKKKYKRIIFLEFSTSKEALEAVAFGLADATIEDFFTANYIIKKQMLSNLHIASKITIDGGESYSLHLMFQKNNQILQTLFNKAISSVTEEELLKIKNKWLGSSANIKSIIISSEEKKYLQNKKIINMCIDPNWMPLEKNKNGQHIGMSSEYINLIEEKINIPIKLINTKSWSESLSFAQKRKCDILSLAMQTPQRKSYMNFTKPYLNIPLVLVSKVDKIFYPELNTIKGESIGIVSGYGYRNFFRVKYPNINLVEVESIKDGLDRVEKEELFGFIDTLPTVAYQIQSDYFGSLKIIGKFDEKWELGIAIRNDAPLLLSVFEKAISSIDEEKHQQILNKWIPLNYTVKAEFKYLRELFYFICAIIIFIIYRHYQLLLYNKQLKKLSFIDKLTGIYNRSKLDDMMLYEKKLFDRFQRPLSIILFDIDDFKKVNDKFGHQIGDKILQEISQIILDNKRKTDVFGRWGGEEFLLICHETDIKGAVELAEKFRKAIFAYTFTEAKLLSASFGVAEFKKGDSIEKVFTKVDGELYKAKKKGKNLVFYYED